MIKEHSPITLTSLSNRKPISQEKLYITDECTEENPIHQICTYTSTSKPLTVELQIMSAMYTTY